MNKTVQIICDGGCRNNQTPDKREAYGSFILKVSPELIPFPPIIHKRFYGNQTNNEAEYMALIDALEWVKEKYPPIEQLIIKTDSQLLIGHLSQGWRVKEPRLKELYEKVKCLIQDILCSPPAPIGYSRIVFEKVQEQDMKQIIGH